MRRTPLARGDKALQRNKPLRQRSNRPGAVAKREADRAWKTDVMRYYGGMCVYCGNVGATQAHHCYPKGSHPEHRHALWNGVPMHGRCHQTVHGHAELLRAYQTVAQEQRRAIDGKRPWPTYEEIRQTTTEARLAVSLEHSRVKALAAGEGFDCA